MKLAIQKKNQKVIGLFEKNISFDPSTAIGDLIDYSKGISCEENILRVASNFHQVFKQSLCDDKLRLADYFDKVCDIRNQILSDLPFTIIELEKLRSFYGLTFTFDVLTADNTPLLFGFYSSKEVLAYNSEDNHCYIYTCHSMLDVTFSILHYLLLNGYKFRYCEHCEKLFATRSLKQKYCKRKSSYPGYEQLECEQAVDHIMKMLKKRKHSIRVYLDNNYPSAVDSFLADWEIFGGKKAEKSVINLMALEKTTSKEGRKRWYRNEYK